MRVVMALAAVVVVVGGGRAIAHDNDDIPSAGRSYTLVTVPLGKIREIHQLR